MNFCLSSRQTKEYLAQADQIKVASNDYKQIYDLIEQYSDKQIILNCADQPKDALKELAILSQNKLILCLFQISDINLAKELKLRYYLAFPALTVEQLRTYKNLGVCYALIDNELMHQLHYTKRIGIPIRAIPNISYLDGMPRENGVIGNWFRPEDVDEYSLYIDTIEFGTQPEKREQTLFRIYSKDKEWTGRLDRIVQDLNYPALNHNINSRDSLRRMNCGMTCAAGSCTLCYDILKISNALPRFRASQNQGSIVIEGER